MTLLTDSQVRSVQGSQIDLMLERNIPRAVLVHACRGGNENDRGKGKQHDWDLGRVWGCVSIANFLHETVQRWKDGNAYLGISFSETKA